MGETTLREIRTRSVSGVTQELEAVLDKAEPAQFHSPDFLNVWYWQLVVSFILGFGASALANMLPKKRALTKADVAEIEALLDERRAGPLVTSDPTASIRAIYEQLPATLPDQERREAAERIGRTLLDTLPRA